jgi:hypothetical protein
MTPQASNFAFLPPAFKDLAEAARKAEAQIMGEPRASSALYARNFDPLSHDRRRIQY